MAGPTLLICGAIHGDELNGVEIVRRIRGLSLLKQLHGTLVLVPVVNLFVSINLAICRIGETSIVVFLAARKDRSLHASRTSSATRSSSDARTSSIFIPAPSTETTFRRFERPWISRAFEKWRANFRYQSSSTQA